MKKFKWFLWFLLILSFIWLLFMNNTVISLDYGFGIFRAPLLVTLLAAYLLGALSGIIPLFIFCVRLLRKNKADHQTKAD